MIPDKLSDIERAMLANQFRILSFLEPADQKESLTKAEILERGYTGLYSEVFEDIENEISRDICTETHDILEMFDWITNVTSALTPEEKATLDLKKIKFDGFDANNDPHYHFALFMIEEQGKYQKHLGLNKSHTSASMIRYKEMLPIYKAFRHNHIDFGITELKQLIAAVV